MPEAPPATADSPPAPLATADGGSPPPIPRIRRFLAALARRERFAVLLEVAGRSLIVAFACLFLMILAVALRWDRGLASAALVFVGGAGTWFAVVVPFARRWSPAGDALRQARLAEALAPALRGRLVTVVEHDQRGDEQDSPLLGLAARRAVAALPPDAPRRIHRLVRELGLVAAGLALAVLPLPLSFIAGGPASVARWWAAGLDASAALAALDLGEREPLAQVGDLVLRYTYPEYTGLDPRVVENSTGDAQGPPGTRVEFTARSADVIEAAGLVAYDQRFEAEVREGRQVTGSYLIGAEEGTWLVETWVGGVSRRSRAFAITPELDLPPEVMLDGPEDTVELAVDELLELTWRARDDHGVARVAIRVDEREVRKLFGASQRQAEAFGEAFVTPGELGLAPGAEVTLDIGATDGDTISGAKVGVSRPIRLVVLGAKGVRMRSEQRTRELVDILLTALADHLEEPSPVSRTSGDLARWGEAVAGRYESLHAVIDRDWATLPDAERTVLRAVVDAAGKLVRFTQVAFEPGSTKPATSADLEEVATLTDGTVVALEDAVLALDGMLREGALADAVEAAERLEEIGQELASLLQDPNADTLELLARLEQLEAQMAELAQAAAKLDEGGLKEFLNARTDEARSLMEEIRKAIEEGRTEDAKTMMERLAKQLQQMAQGMRDTLDARQSEGEEQMEQADALIDELKRLEDAQRALQQQVNQIREQEDQQSAQQEEATWDAIQREAAALVEDIGSYRDELVDADRGFNETQRAEAAEVAADRLLDAAASKDLRAARGAHQASEFGVDAMFRGFQAASFMERRGLEGPGEDELAELHERLATIERLLDQLENSQASPQTRQAAQQLQQQQQQLEQQLQQARERAEELAQDFPVRPGDMEERLEEGAQRMGEASDDLGQGRPMPAEGSQGAAADRIREAREALEQAKEQAEQMGQGLEGGRPEDGKGGDGEDGDDHQRPPDDFELPTAEEFRTPEEYRRALLEGMEGEVPEEFRALKKRYFEELVRQ